MKQNDIDNYQDSGFTLIEVLVALLISGIVMSSVYSAFQSQQDSYLAQDQVAEMQQNIRSGVDMMSREIRLAGYDPSESASAGVTVATVAQFAFTQDLDEDGDVTTVPGETVTFKLNDDGDGDGIVDGGGVSTLGRTTGAGVSQPIAENIEAIEFYYTLKDGTQTLAPGNLDNIRTVQISILARSGNSDQNFTGTQIFNTASGAVWGTFNDNFRRRFATLTIQCRNMGL